MANMTNVEVRRRAKVLWWDPERVYVLCPWCDRSHYHQFSGAYHDQLGDAPCRPSPCDTAIYSIDYPIDPPNIGYEIDKKNCRYITKLGLEHQKDLLSNGLIQNLRQNFRKKIERKQTWSATMEESLVWEDAEERKMGQDATVRPIDIVCFRMKQGDLEFVKNFLESSSDAVLFLNGVHSGSHSKQSARGNGKTGFVELEKFTYGTTALHIAARGQYSEIVRLLVTKGANINAQDVYGCTPLMEAAFWGRLENVRILLDRGANDRLQCILDGRSKTAEDLAVNTRSNAWIRRKRAGRPAREPLIKEDTYTRDCDRDDVRHLLRGKIRDPTALAHPALKGFAFGKDKEHPNIFSSMTYYSLPDEWTAVAVLHRGPNLPDVSAMSGWNHDNKSDKPFISGKEWTAKVLSLSRWRNFQLRLSVHDDVQDGQYEASHAEKQLIAYLIDRHWFREEEMILPGQMDGLVEDAANLTIQNSHKAAESQQRERAKREKLGRLRAIMPEHRLKEAIIMVSKPICYECNRFIEELRLPSEIKLKAYGYHIV